MGDYSSIEELIGSRISQARGWQGMSQRELSLKADIPQSQLNKIEKGNFTALNARRLRRLAQILGVPSDWILVISGSDSCSFPLTN